MTATALSRAPTPADNDLVAAVSNGDLEALGVLFERYEPALRRYLGRVGVASSVADDLIQATFLEVVRAARRFDRTHPFRSWLFGIASVMLRRHRRSLNRTAARVAAWAGLLRGEPPPTPADSFEGGDTLRRLARAFDRLSLKKREVFVLVTLECLSGEETAAVLGIPVNTVWTRLHHARLELRAALTEDEA